MTFLLQKEALSSDRRKQFQKELDTLSGALKAKYDKINKEYQGICLSFNLMNTLCYYFNRFRGFNILLNFRLASGYEIGRYGPISWF